MNVENTNPMRIVAKHITLLMNFTKDVEVRFPFLRLWKVRKTNRSSKGFPKRVIK